MSHQPKVMQANGNISPCRFVKEDTSANNAVKQAGAGELVIGISQEGFDSAPIPLNTSGYAAIAGENVNVFTMGTVCLLELGADVSTERRLKADSNGKGTPVVGGAASMENWGAIALEAASSGEKVLVQVVGPMTVSHPASSSAFS